MGAAFRKKKKSKKNEEVAPASVGVEALGKEAAADMNLVNLLDYKDADSEISAPNEKPLLAEMANPHTASRRKLSMLMAAQLAPADAKDASTGLDEGDEEIDMEAFGKNKRSRESVLRKRAKKTNTNINSSRSYITERFGNAQMRSSRSLTYKYQISEFSVSSYKSAISESDRQGFKKYKDNTSSTIRIKELLSLATLKRAKNQKDNIGMSKKVINGVCSYLDLEALANDDEKDEKNETFQAKFVSENELPIKFFLLRLVTGMDKWFAPEDSPGLSAKNIVGIRCLLLSLAYVGRIKMVERDFEITFWNAHRLFGVLFLIAAKMTEDEMIINTFWADVCGMELEELNALENDVFFASQVDFHISPVELRNVSVAVGVGDILEDNFLGLPPPSSIASQSQMPDMKSYA